jgi:predicted AAA+ superfamily ATPase
MEKNDIMPLVAFYHSKLQQTETTFKRYLYNQINWDARIIGIKGARGVGKTTMLLQRILEKYPDPDKTFYISLDHFWFNSNDLIRLVEYLYSMGIKELYVDEVHKYKGWSQLLKNLYDQYADIKIVYTGSSILEIDNSKTDLSRRQTLYSLKGMSFREYLEYEGIISVPPISLTTLVQDHVRICMDLTKSMAIRPLFETYLERGYYPFYKDSGIDYLPRLAETANIVIENDLPSVEDISYPTVEKTKKLLGIVAGNVPFKPNIEKLAKSLGSTRDSCLKMLYLLDKAEQLALLTSELKNYKRLVKPEKIYLGNTNLMYAFGARIDVGTLRETFFINQLSANHTVQSSSRGDFLIDGRLTFEIGGNYKDFSQVADLPDSYLGIDGIETGFHNRIPLWMFGMMY